MSFHFCQVTNSCTFCSNIGYILYNLEYLKILWYHDTSLVCPITCSALNSKTLPPNGDFVGDSATNSIAIQLSNLATNPLLSTGWYDDQGLFIGSLCKFTFGTTFTDSSNSGSPHVKKIWKRHFKFLIFWFSSPFFLISKSWMKLFVYFQELTTFMGMATTNIWFLKFLTWPQIHVF